VAYGAAQVADGAPANGAVGDRGAELGAAARALGTAVEAAIPGVPSPYYQPAPARDALRPGLVIDAGRDAPDPFMLVEGGRDYLYTSQGTLFGVNVPVRAGPSPGHLGPIVDALPTLPAWAAPGYTWAPDVHRFADHYVLYFTSEFVGSSPGVECIEAATGGSPMGPFHALPVPFVCQLDHHGSIDPRTFTDVDGRTYLLWKSDDNADVHGSERSGIYTQLLGPDGLSPMGAPTWIMGPDQHWQGRIVEAPDLVVAHGVYWLFYSGNWFNQPDYAIGVARCAGPLGPCTDTARPFLASNHQGAGPGEQSLFRDAAGVWLLYTPTQSLVPRQTPPRPVSMTRIGFGPAGPYLADPRRP
jgi:hypothetical protein